LGKRFSDQTSEPVKRARECSPPVAGRERIDLKTLGFVQGPVEAEGATADNRWTQIVAGKWIVNDGSLSLHADGSRCSKIKPRATASDDDHQQRNVNCYALVLHGYAFRSFGIERGTLAEPRIRTSPI